MLAEQGDVLPRDLRAEELDLGPAAAAARGGEREVTEQWQAKRQRSEGRRGERAHHVGVTDEQEHVDLAETGVCIGRCGRRLSVSGLVVGALFCGAGNGTHLEGLPQAA